MKRQSNDSMFFYLTLQDGTVHSVGNIGNTWLLIDEDYYEAEHEWLSTWEDIFGEGTEPLPEGYFSGQEASDSGEGTGIGGDGGTGNQEPAGTGREQPDSNHESMSSQDMVIWEDSDLDRDGETEILYVCEIADGEAYELKVEKKDGTLLWSREAGTPHAGWGAFLLYQDGGKDYLVEYFPTIYQGMGSYTCTQLSLEGGLETEENQWTAEFQLPVQEMDGRMRAFAEIGNMIMKDGVALLSTVEGELVIGPVAAAEVPQLYPVSFGTDEDQAATDGSTASGQGLATEGLSGATLFEDGQPLHFLFASGAGAWGTTLTLYPDGSFEGVYEDGEAVAAPEYPRGTRYICRFSGQFSKMTQISDSAYSMQLEELNCETEADRVWIEDQERYIGAEALGVEGGEEFILYLPDTVPDGSDEEFLSWWPDNYLWRNGSVKTLDSYGLYNVNTGQGFFTSWLR